MDRPITRRGTLALTATLALGAVATSLPAIAADYPEKPVTLVVPYKAGGSTETMARLYSKALAKELGQSVIVKTRPGGGGAVGATEVAAAPPDGYTLLFGASSSLLWPPLTQSVEYGLDSFDYVGQVTEYQQALVAKSDAPFNTLAELIDYSRTHSLNYADQSPMSRMFINYIAAAAAVDWTGIPTRGGGEMVPFLLGGKIDFAYSGGIHNRYSDQTKVLTSMNAGRLLASPDVPSIKEEYGIFMPSQAIIVVPKGTPKDVTARIEKAMEVASKDPAFVEITMKKLKFPVKFVGSKDLTTDIDNAVKAVKMVIEKTK